MLSYAIICHVLIPPSCFLYFPCTFLHSCLRYRNETKRNTKLINHYLGSWESYNARPNDARKGLNARKANADTNGTNASNSRSGATAAAKRDNNNKWSENAKSYENWLQKSTDTRGRESVVVRPWLRGFIKLVGGPKIAAHLLRGAGIVLPSA